MIKFENVTKSYGADLVLDNISFKLNQGEKLGLVGRNGSGKTTILRLITDQEQADAGLIEIPKNYSIGYLSQHLQFHHETLIEEVAQALKANESDQTHKAEKILFGLGFKEEDLYANPINFSGGYQLRIHLAKVIVSDPDCLLLDEPTNYLDIVSIRWFTRFLSNWTRELMVISHDREFMDSVTTHTLGIHRKKTRKLEGGTEKFYAQLLQDEHIHEQTRVKLEKKRAHLESFVTRFGAKATKAAQAQSRVKAMSRMPVLEELAKLHHLDFSFPYSPLPAIKVADVSQINFGYDGMAEPLIKDFNLTIEKGDRIAIIGKNGRGKSTLLRLLAQDLKPQHGSIKVSSNTKTGFFGQTNIDRLHPKMTIEEEISSAAPHLTISDIRKTCGVMMFSGDSAKKQIAVLSGGERSRVLLGKILVSSCNLLLLDEPTNHLDMESVEALITAMDEFEGAIVIVTHSELILNQIPTKFVICHQGNQKFFEGSYEDFLEKIGWEDTSTQNSTKAKNSKDNLPDNKKKRVELINLRSKTLQPIQKKIDAIEVKINQLESVLQTAIDALILASQNNESAKIVLLSKEIDEKKAEIECSYKELEVLLQTYEEKKNFFDNSLITPN